MFASERKKGSREPAPMLRDSAEFVETDRQYVMAHQAHEAAVERKAQVTRDLRDPDTLVVLRARTEINKVSHAELVAREKLARAARARADARRRAQVPVAAFHEAQVRAALADVRDALREVDGGAMRRLRECLRAAQDAGVVVDGRNVVPALWWTESSGLTGLDAWEQYHRRNRNL